MTHNPAYLVIDALATYRLAVLAVEDKIFDTPRQWIIEHSHFGMELVTCPWCISIWIGAVVVACTALTPVWFFYVAAALAFSAVAGALSTLVR